MRRFSLSANPRKGCTLAISHQNSPGTANGQTVQLTDLDGKPISLADFAGTSGLDQLLGVMVPAVSGRDADPARYLRDHADEGLTLVAVSVQETTADDVRAYVERYSLPFTVGFDATSAIFHAYHAYVLPTQIFIDREGVIRNVTLGMINRANAEAILAPLLANPAQAPRRARTGGAALASAARSIRPSYVRCPSRRRTSPATFPRAVAGNCSRVQPGAVPHVALLIVAHYTVASNLKRSRSATKAADRLAGSCDRTTVQPSSAACRNRLALTSTLVSGKSSKPGTQRGLALHGRMHRSPKKPTVPFGPRTTMAWWPPEWPPVRTTDTPGRTSSSPCGQHRRAHGSDEAQLVLLVGGLQSRVRAQRELPLVPLGDDPRAREGAASPSAVRSPPA